MFNIFYKNKSDLFFRFQWKTVNICINISTLSRLIYLVKKNYCGSVAQWVTRLWQTRMSILFTSKASKAQIKLNTHSCWLEYPVFVHLNHFKHFKVGLFCISSFDIKESNSYPSSMLHSSHRQVPNINDKSNIVIKYLNMRFFVCVYGSICMKEYNNQNLF